MRCQNTFSPTCFSSSFQNDNSIIESLAFLSISLKIFDQNQLKYDFSYGESSDSGKLPKDDLDALLTLSLENFRKDYLSKVKLKRR